MKKIKFYHILLFAVVIVSVINLVPYIFENHTFLGGIGVKHHDAFHETAFIENLKYYKISYEIDNDGIVWYTKSDEDKVDKFKKKINYKLANEYDIEHEISKLKKSNFEVLTFPYPATDSKLIMWHEK